MTRFWRTSYGLRLRSQARQDIFCTATPSPAPTEASVIALDHWYCVCTNTPFLKERFRETCNAWKLLFPSFLFWPTPANCGNGRTPVTGSIRLVVSESESLWPSLP